MGTIKSNSNNNMNMERKKIKHMKMEKLSTCKWSPWNLSQQNS